MKRRILFVDDEPLVLRVYGSTFQRTQPEWEVVCTGDGLAALQLMEARPFDVIVSDMRMPEMNGAELLNEVMRRHPGTARLILSAYSDQDLVLQCVGATHQWLSKPCSIGALRSAIGRICALESLLGNTQLKSILTQIHCLPSLPRLYHQILEELESPHATIEGIGHIIERDLAMTPKILQLVNSAFFGQSHHITDAAEAVQVLGIGTIRALTLTLHVFSCFKPEHCPGLDLERLWIKSLRTGMLAQRIARLEQADQLISETAYTAGLLRETGCMILAASLPDAYRDVWHALQTRRLPLHQAEREILGVSHAEVGAYLFGLWGLPASITEAIAWQYSPSQSVNRLFSPLTAIHVAAAIDEELHPVSGAPCQLDMNHLNQLGLAGRVESWRNLCAQVEVASL